MNNGGPTVVPACSTLVRTDMTPPLNSSGVIAFSAVSVIGSESPWPSPNRSKEAAITGTEFAIPTPIRPIPYATNPSGTSWTLDRWRNSRPACEEVIPIVTAGRASNTPMTPGERWYCWSRTKGTAVSCAP